MTGFDVVPKGVREREQWLLWDANADKPRQPHWRGNFNISWSDPNDWHAFEEAVEAAHERDSWGIGYVVTPDDPFYIIDIDGPYGRDGEPRGWFPGLDRFEDAAYMEWSPGGGIHIPVRGEPPEWWSDCEIDPDLHQGVDVLTNKFCTVTGDVLDSARRELATIDATPWLLKVYRNIEGALPGGEGHPEGDTGTDIDDELDRDELQAALDHVDPDISHTEWVRIGFAVHDWDSGSTGRQVFEQWSKQGSKWDKDAKRTVEWIWSNADPGGGVSLATLIYEAKQAGYEPPGSDLTGDEAAENPLYRRFRDALEFYKLNPGAVATTTNDDGEKIPVGVEQILPDDDESDIGDAVMAFNRRASKLSGTDKQAVIGRVVLLDLRDRGEFFQTIDGRVYFFYEPEHEVYRVDGSGNRVLNEEFQAMVWNRYKLFAGKFSRNLGADMKSQASRSAPTKEVYQFAHYDADASELYVTDWDAGYYAVSPEGIEWRPNGTDVYFLSDTYAESYDYLDPTERPTLPTDLPGERPVWVGGGDPIMRLFGNRINYNEGANLGPDQQRHQLYLHLHTLPFIDLLNARPIMAWVGEKGSGKTVIERSIGQFIYGADYSESVMPDAKDDFLAKVTNQALAFIDNYDDGEDWANDVLAAVATGAGLDKRELYTTNTLRRETPRCWLSITSRDPPFRRDDVADRTLVFRVDRVDDGFVGMGTYLRQVAEYRDLLWSTYLDNLQAVVAEYQHRDTDTMSSTHRMADWAIFARVVADALGIDRVDELLETMETERATFALENEPWAAVIGEWVRSDPEDAAIWRSASSLVDHLNDRAENSDRTFPISSPSGLGSKLTHYHSELSELYSLEIDETGRSNEYRFDVRDETTVTGLDRF